MTTFKTQPAKVITQARYKIGIDPGIRSGYALWDSKEQRFSRIKTLCLWQLFEELNTHTVYPSMHQVYIENPNTFIPFKRLSADVIESRRQGAGAVKQTYKHIIEFLEDHKIPYEATRLQGGLKKKDAEFFKKQTGWTGRTDEHGRDAAFLVWKR